MTTDLQESINRFIDYFKKQLTEIETLQTKHLELYRKLLYVSVLDTLAGAALPQMKMQNRERFTSFLELFCHWQDGTRVSLPHLVQFLNKNPDPAFGALRKWAVKEFNALPVQGSELMPINHDPLVDDVRKNGWPTSPAKLQGFSLERLQHYHLLYAYRNGLVHEMRMLGYGMDFRDNSRDPFYHTMTKHDANRQPVETSIELVYPWRFLHDLCDSALSQLKTYFSDEKLDPFDSFGFGTYWIRELNP